jgi:hypothetical protein
VKIKCECGFQGTLREENGFGKCFGCDRLYQKVNGKVQVMSTKIPDFKSWEDMQKYLDKVPKGGKAAPKKRVRKKKAVEVDTSSNLQEEAPKVPVYKTIHFYVRPGDSFEQVLKDGREEGNFAGPGTLVFVHNHLHAEVCTDSCRGIG